MSEKITNLSVTLRQCVSAIFILFLASAAYAQNVQTITVNCNNGQSLNSTLSKLVKQIPTTVIVQGTCTEFVTVNGFEGLTLRGEAGAALQQPATNPQANSYLLSITGSQGVTVSGLAVHSLSSIFSGIGIGGGSSQVLLQDLSIDGSWGVATYEESQVWLVHVSVNITSGFAAIAAFDKSDVHIAGALLERPSDSGYYTGIFAGSGHVTMQGMTIRDMQVGITVDQSGSVDLVDDMSTLPSDVTIENPSGVNLNGAVVSDGSSLNLESARLIIKNAGQTSGGTTGAIFVTNNSVLNAGANLVVSGSRGQGVLVTNDSHATLAGSSITGSVHGGVVVANLSSVDVQPSSTSTLVGGNTPDLFCDSNSLITGTANLAGAPTVNCSNLLTGNTVPLP